MSNEFFRTLNELRSSNEPFVVASVVKVSGSTYRRPGARVIITKDGTLTGLISGGCFESDLMERAKSTMASRQVSVATFDTTSPDDLIFGLGLGCTGVAQILLEPFQGNRSQEYLDFIRSCISNRTPGVVATIFRLEGRPLVPLGTHLMIGKDEYRLSTPEFPMTDAIIADGRKVLQEKRSRVKTYSSAEGSIEVLLEWIVLPVSLVIFGAGPDAVPLTQLAHQLGWQVQIIDRRPALVRPDRFPDADRVMLLEPEDLKTETIDTETAVVVMTHHFETDLSYLKKALALGVRYIGLLGPKAKAEMLFQRLRDDGIQLTEEQRSRIYGPVGLDIGAETPEEIALSIVAEIQAVYQDYSAGFLKNRSTPIHVK